MIHKAKDKFLKLRTKFLVGASTVVLTATSLILITSPVYAGTTDHFIELNSNQAYGWCPHGTGYPVTLGNGCNDYVWAFTSGSKFAGYTTYQITINGLCATVAEGNGAHYSLNDIVLEGCVGASNQYFVNPSNPGPLDSVWAGDHYYCGALGAWATGSPGSAVYVDACNGSQTSWYLPLD